MTDEEKVRDLFEECRHLIEDDGASRVSHYIDHNEHEMAFEGLVLELISADATPKNFQFSEWEELARRMRLAEDAVFDGDFWSKFLAWGRTRG